MNNFVTEDFSNLKKILELKKNLNNETFRPVLNLTPKKRGKEAP